MPKEYGTPGPRAIHPEICDSPSLGRCGIVANALFPRLVARADDQGRLAGQAEDVRAECMGKLRYISSAEVRKALTELQRQGMVRLYRIAGEPYVQLEHWWAWQASMRRAYPSRHPAPPGWDDRVYGTGDAGHGRPEQPRAAEGGIGPPNAALGGTTTQGVRPPPTQGVRTPGARPDPTRPDHHPPAGARGGTTNPDGLVPLADLLPPPPGHRPKES